MYKAAGLFNCTGKSAPNCVEENTSYARNTNGDVQIRLEMGFYWLVKAVKPLLPSVAI